MRAPRTAARRTTPRRAACRRTRCRRASPHLPLPRDDAAVSPVVGTVLLIAIMLITVTALLQWGLPAIQGLQRESQYKSALSAFSVLDGLIDEVLPEEGSSRQSRIPLADGSLRAETDSEPFALGLSRGIADITFADLGDGDADVTFDANSGGYLIDTCRFTHYFKNGTQRGTFTQTITATTSGTCTADRALDETHRLELFEGGTSGTLHADVWLFHVGLVRFTANNPQGAFNMDYVNGAVATDVSRNVEWIVNDPLMLVLEPDGLTVGMIDLNGTGGTAGGDAVVRIQATLDGAFVRADAQTVRLADVYPLGDMDQGWLLFLNTSSRYDFAHTSGDLHARYDPGGDFPLTLTHYVVDVEVLGVGG